DQGLTCGPAAELCRSGATRSRAWNCDTVMSPTVLPVVSYRDVPPWQRGGTKLSGQRTLTLRGGRESVSRLGDCQHQGGWGPGWVAGSTQVKCRKRRHTEQAIAVPLYRTQRCC